ncbi:MAG: sensor histidine kinase [Planctomycetota bacterium]|jgi:signal transduction histidine kinase
MARNSPDLTSLAFEALPHAVLIIDADGVITARNSAAEEILPAGDRVEEVLAVEPESPFAWPDALAALAQAPRGLRHRNLPITGKGSRRLLIDLYLGLLVGAGAGANAALVVVEDVSARASMERRLAASERLAAAGELASKVGHELNNPLDGVMRYVGLAERECGPKAAEYLSKARMGLGRMSEIVRELMDETTARRSPGRHQHVEKLLDEAVVVMNPRAQALGVSVVSDIAETGGAGVSGSVFQVFCNVIKNALDAMPNGGVLKIRQRCGGKECISEFADTGCGLAEGQADAMFQPFYSTKPPGEGAGLGLAICREILSRLGGTITAANRPEGGAVVTVKFPLRPNLHGEAEG